jgi:hypothetical protein
LLKRAPAVFATTVFSTPSPNDRIHIDQATAIALCRAAHSAPVSASDGVTSFCAGNSGCTPMI